MTSDLGNLFSSARSRVEYFVEILPLSEELLRHAKQVITDGQRRHDGQPDVMPENILPSPRTVRQRHKSQSKDKEDRLKISYRMDLSTFVLHVHTYPL